MTDIEWPEATINELLDQVELASGHHTDGVQACAMDLIGMAVQGEWSDTPECVHPILARKVHQINDSEWSTPESRRRLVLDAGPRLIGTADRTAWAVLVSHAAGSTVGGLVDALATVPTDANLRGANLRGADLVGADLVDANLRGSHLADADLRNAYLGYADLGNANLAGADLRGADLMNANLAGAYLGNAYLGNAYLRSARANTYTVWPDDFDAAAAGVVTS